MNWLRSRIYYSRRGSCESRLWFANGTIPIINKIGQRADHTLRTNSPQFKLCTEQTYQALIDIFSINKMTGFKRYSELKAMGILPKSIFNLWEGNKYKSNILKYPKDYRRSHPTQKPVLLIEDLIKTFSNKGDLIVDLTAGSGTTGIACLNTNRNFILIEKDERYYEIAKMRINEYSIKNG